MTTTPSLRPGVVQSAVQFLTHPSVRDQPQDKQLAFLFKKGVTPSEAAHAYRAVIASSKQSSEQSSHILNQARAPRGTKVGMTVRDRKHEANESEGKEESSQGVLSTIGRALGSLFVSEEEEEEPEPVGSLSLLELSQFNGIMHERLLVSLELKIYDVTKRWDLYGPGKKYNVFVVKYAGNDATYAFATMSTDKASMNIFDKQLGEEQKEILGEWRVKYQKSYKVVGSLDRQGSAKEAKGTKNTEVLPRSKRIDRSVSGSTS